ncbi:ABC transporter, ATPbinding domain containing protein, partial [Acanthamoeba castellanii str. Neff]
METEERPPSHSAQSDDHADVSSDSGLDDEPKLKIKDRDYLFSDWIKETRQVNNPNFEPIFVAVDNLTYRVPALPPTRHHRSVFSVVADAVRRFIPEKGPKPIPILDDVSFYLKPGQMTLLLGAPGCGKSSLLKLLANRLRVGKVEGNLTFNGKVPKRKHYHRDVAFIQQEDVHLPTLTVKETLRLSADCQMPRGVSSQAKADRVEAIMQLLGLKHRANTIVGDALLRGVSGGEKKRVSVGIEWAKSPGVWLFDEPTTGLDSSASYDEMRALRTIVDMGGAALVSLLQPSYEVFHLFDN